MWAMLEGLCTSPCGQCVASSELVSGKMESDMNLGFSTFVLCLPLQARVMLLKETELRHQFTPDCSQPMGILFSRKSSPPSESSSGFERSGNKEMLARDIPEGTAEDRRESKAHSKTSGHGSSKHVSATLIKSGKENVKSTKNGSEAVRFACAVDDQSESQKSGESAKKDTSHCELIQEERGIASSCVSYL